MQFNPRFAIVLSVSEAALSTSISIRHAGTLTRLSSTVKIIFSLSACIIFGREFSRERRILSELSVKACSFLGVPLFRFSAGVELIGMHNVTHWTQRHEMDLFSSCLRRLELNSTNELFEDESELSETVEDEIVVEVVEDILFEKDGCLVSDGIRSRNFWSPFEIAISRARLAGMAMFELGMVRFA